MEIAPVDLVELVKAIFLGLAALCVPLATVYIMILSSRTRTLVERTADLGTKIDGLLVDRDAQNVAKGRTAGEAAGRDTADALAEGQRQGRDAERRAGAVIRDAMVDNSAKPLPVVDEAAAAVAKRTAEATEKSAEAQTKIADAAVKRKEN